MSKLIGVLRKNNTIAILSQKDGEYDFQEITFDENIKSDFIMGPVWNYTDPEKMANYSFIRSNNHNILLARLERDPVDILVEKIIVGDYICFLSGNPRELINYQRVDAEPISFYADENICDYCIRIVCEEEDTVDELDVETTIKEIQAMSEKLEQLNNFE